MAAKTPTILPDVDDDDETPDATESPQEETDDIDPADWLIKDESSDLVGRYTLPNGKTIKISSLTDDEVDKLRRMSKKSVPNNPREKKIDGILFKRNMIAHSINKAHGYQIGDPRYIMADHLKDQPAGRLGEMLTRIMALSEMPESNNTPASDFLD